jgi:4-amino-4-deoxy-L-arabinose transferase-like glycosyltransferase
MARTSAQLLREWEFWILALVAAAIYFPRLTDLPIRGEETRRAEVAREMLHTGDWVVPRQQGVPLLSRPPLGSYPIALGMRIWGDASLLAVRLPSALATWLTTLLIYGYSRVFLARLGALAAGLAFATMGQVLTLGRLAETEAIYTLLVSGSLLLWHWGYSRSWSKTLVWTLGYALAALAALTKSLQGPAYFAIAVCLYLVLQKDWRTLFGWPHLAGLAAFTAIVGAWLVPFWLMQGWPAAHAIWTGDVALRFADVRPAVFFRHLASYPIELLICTLPWSPLLGMYCWRDFRRSLGRAAPAESVSPMSSAVQETSRRLPVMFLAVALAVALPTCWLVPGAKGRYFMPMYPCLAPLVGLVIQRVFEPGAMRILSKAWSATILALAAAALFGGLSVAGTNWTERFALPELAQPRWFAALYAAVAIGVSLLLVRIHGRRGPRLARIVLLTVAALIGLSYVGVAINGMVAIDDNAGPAIAALKRKLPPDVRLVSFGLTETLFTFYYDEPIEPRPWPTSSADLEAGRDYFCFTWDKPAPPDLPFAWRIEAMISADRKRHAWPQKEVIVARRLDLSDRQARN